MIRYKLLKLFYDLGDGLAWAPNRATFRSKASGLAFLEAAPGWTVRYVPERR